MVEVLDVGCGCTPKGTVNVDLFVGLNPNHAGFLDPKSIPNFVNCDAQHLPFRDGCFDFGIIDNVLEHLDNPFLAVAEMKRVCLSFVAVVPVSQFRLYVYSAIGLFRSFFAIPFLGTTEHFFGKVRDVRNWRRVYGDEYIHKWVVRFRLPKRTVFRHGFPLMYAYSFGVEAKAV